LLLEPVEEVAVVAGALLIVLGGLALAGERIRPTDFRARGLAFAAATALLFSTRDNLRALGLGRRARELGRGSRDRARGRNARDRRVRPALRPAPAAACRVAWAWTTKSRLMSSQ